METQEEKRSSPPQCAFFYPKMLYPSLSNPLYWSSLYKIRVWHR